MNRQMYTVSIRVRFEFFYLIYSRESIPILLKYIKIYYFFLLFIFKDGKGFDKIFIKILIIISLYNNNPSLSFIVTYI